MRVISSITAIIPLLSLGQSIPHGPRAVHEFDLTELHGSFPTDGVYGTGPIASSLSITVSYPDPSSNNGANLTTSCSYAWPASIAPGPTDWTTCQDPSVEWRLPEKGWTSYRNYRVELYQTLTADGAGLDATHYLTQNPATPSDPNAYLSCIQMGKFTPTICQLNGPLSALPGPVVMYASEETARPN
ncbi:hypothetical protein SAMD00023353_5200880 [Rosellinia necatrix]|uniref:Uncharacterized protein n=1 Tax=Rosellinia necatrix TaxID=77044 RepID=A0A1W2TQL0_ROSNE|nr:hypothetical protein SAMD00023353_5200880 [Rosellinia necatrix]